MSKKRRIIFFISYISAPYIIAYSSLHLAAPCQRGIDIFSALLIFLGVNKACYLLVDFYHWYKGNNEAIKERIN
jgi:uncharacterized membrane protein (DUF485 family)